MALSINKTWANYTECALLFSSESRSHEKVTLLIEAAGDRGWDGDEGSGQGNCWEPGFLPLRPPNKPCSPLPCSRPRGWGKKWGALGCREAVEPSPSLPGSV